jgi:hypothetical protein
MITPPSDSDATRYVSTVLTLYLGLPETPLRPSAQDRRCARDLYDRSVPLPVIESAFLLASLRRLLRPADLPPLSPIRSLAYFQPVIAELLSNPAPDNYLDYLRYKLHRIASGKNIANGSPPADVQKTTFSDDR